MRLPFLILTPACVLLGTATAIWSGSEINIFYLIPALIGAVSAHISVNALNEYDDFKSGLDLTTERTPFSGGSGTLPEQPDKAHVALITGLITLAVTAVVGVYFLLARGAWLLHLGLLGLMTIVAYTKFLTRNPFLCLIAPGLGFGPLMVMGTDFVLTGSYSWTAFIASLVPFFLVSDLLLLNQFPDLEADKEIGRRHVPIALGRNAGVVIYGLFLAGAYVSIVLGYLFDVLPFQGLLGLGSVVIAVPTVRGVKKYADDIPKLIPYMGKNVVINILTPVLLAIGLFIS
ncbi:MAG: prenyltransferase [Deltaproteobacteria bacterium]|nr:prenyltransferase [Deltaproteobacteria bacterium]